MSEPLKRSQAQEKRVAKMTGGSTNAGSGNGWKRKGDVRAGGREGVLIEMKRTDKKQITLKLDDLEKIRREAYAEGRSPVMHIEIGKRRWVLIPEEDWNYED
jgi:Holliday junction resolvase